MNNLFTKSNIRTMAFMLMFIVIGYGWYTNSNNNAAEEHVQELSTEAKGELVLHTEKDLTIEDGSMINLDFKGTMDGEDVGSTEKADVTVGGGKLSKEFEEKLIGHHPGDHFTIQVTMSDRLSVKKKYRGKVADVEVTINGIYVLE